MLSYKLQTLARNEFAKWRRRTYRYRVKCPLLLCGLNINLESKRNEFFLSVIVFELKYPRRRSFHHLFLFGKQKSSAKKMARHGKELTTEQKEMLLSLSHQGFSSYKIQEFTVELFRNF